MRSPFVVGLTGGIGSGKTAVSTQLGQLGADIIDADVIAHELTAPGGLAIDAIRQTFGEHAIGSNGAMDRVIIRALVFDNAAARAQLENILHPMIRQASQARIACSTAPYCVQVIPLLTEKGGWRHTLNRILVVDCPEARQIERVMQRSQLSREAVQAIMATQATRAQRLAIADDVILNDSEDLSLLHRHVDALHQQYLRLADA